jgi:hypothetical protein
MVMYCKVVVSSTVREVVEHLASVEGLDPDAEVLPEERNRLRHVTDDESR